MNNVSSYNFDFNFNLCCDVSNTLLNGLWSGQLCLLELLSYLPTQPHSKAYTLGVKLVFLNPVAKHDPFIDQKMYLFNCMNIILVNFCPYAFLSSHFVQLLAKSCERHPTILEMAVRHCKPEVGGG